MLTLAIMNAHAGIWQVVQKPMRKVRRWGKTKRYKQTLIEHAFSIQFTVDMVQANTSTTIPAGDCDWQLVHLSIRLHDIGEALLKCDVIVSEKDVSNDAEEANAFFAFIDELAISHSLKQRYKKVFMLQFCLSSEDEYQHFTKEQQEIMQYHRAHHLLEARLHQMIELLDYFKSCLVGHENGATTRGIPMMLEVWGNCAHKLDQLVIDDPRLLPLWSPAYRAEMRAYAENHGLPL